jgi:hypothetical protein
LIGVIALREVRKFEDREMRPCLLKLRETFENIYVRGAVPINETRTCEHYSGNTSEEDEDKPHHHGAGDLEKTLRFCRRKSHDSSTTTKSTVAMVCPSFTINDNNDCRQKPC